MTKKVQFETQKLKGKKIKPKKQIQTDFSDDNDEDAECLYCHYLWSQSEEGWNRCSRCYSWAHCSCAGVDDEDDEATHVCSLCA